MSDLVVLAASAAVVALMVVVALVLGFAQRARLDEDELARLAGEEHARIEAAVIDASGASALAKLADGRLLAAKVMADGISARVSQANALRVRLKRDKLSVALADIGFPSLSLRLAGEAPAWVKSLAKE